MTTSERIEMLQEAQDHLSQAIELISTALQDTEHDRHADAYIIAHLSNWSDAQGYRHWYRTIHSRVTRWRTL